MPHGNIGKCENHLLEKPPYFNRPRGFNNQHGIFFLSITLLFKKEIVLILNKHTHTKPQLLLFLSVYFLMSSRIIFWLLLLASWAKAALTRLSITRGALKIFKSYLFYFILSYFLTRRSQFGFAFSWERWEGWEERGRLNRKSSRMHVAN